MKRKIINTNIRLNLEREADRKAWEYLRNMDRKKYKSYSKAVVIAVNDYFDRQKRIEADSYLETREKEDAFLEKVLSTIQQGMAAITHLAAITQLLSANQPQSKNSITDEEADIALDFADSF